MGLWYIAAALTNGSNPDFIEIFRYYTPGNLGRAYKTMALLQLPVAFLSAATKIPPLFFGKQSVETLICNMIYLLLLFILALFVMGRLFPFISSVVCGADQPVLACLKASLAATKGKSLTLLGFILSFTPWILLSLVTVGTLFIIFTFPYMMVAVSLYSSYLLTGEYRTQILEETL